MEDCLDENIQEKIYLPILTKQNCENKQNNNNCNNYFEENNNEFTTTISSLSSNNNLFISQEKSFKYSEHEENKLLFDSNLLNNLNTEEKFCPSVKSSKISKKKISNRGRRGSKRNKTEFRGEKPRETYIELIAMAIRKQDSHCATLTEIYNYLRQNFEFFRGSYEGWKNCIRHNLSLGNYFEKLPKNAQGKIGKGHLWTFGPNYKSFIEEKQKNLNSTLKRCLTVNNKSKITKNKLELFNKQLIDNNSIIKESNFKNEFINDENSSSSNNLKEENQLFISSPTNSSDFNLFSPNSQQQQLYQIKQNNDNNNNYYYYFNNLINDDQFIPSLIQNNQKQQEEEAQPFLIFSDLINENNNILNIPYYNNYCCWHSRCYIGDNGDYYFCLEALPIYFNNYYAQNQFFNEFQCSTNSFTSSPLTQIFNEHQI